MGRRGRGYISDRGVVDPFRRTGFDVPDLDMRSGEELSLLEWTSSEDGPEDGRDCLVDA